MRHLPFQATPTIYVIPCKCNGYTQIGGVKIKRDDLFGKAGGGSKSRMLQYILNDAQEYDIIVTAGGPCSNFNRACALQCAELGIPMHLILYSDHPEDFTSSMNMFICKLAGVKTTICNKSDVAETINNVVSAYSENGLKVKQIYGGGRSVEGIYAYYAAVEELISQLGGQHIDKVYVACGTGTTVSGIMAGFQKYSPATEIHAISVARFADAEIPIIEENIHMLNDCLGTRFDMRNLHFHEDFILGEYGRVNEELIDFIKKFTEATGILVDPIYTGKALWGMHKLSYGLDTRNSLFWHTGAVYTLLSNISKFSL